MSEHILIIEDDRRLANLIQVYLVRQGYAVDWHDSGEGAEEKIHQLNPDLVILDVMLPQKSGCCLLEYALYYVENRKKMKKIMAKNWLCP